MTIPVEQCMQLLTEYLAARPENTYSDEALGWFADVSAIVESYNPITAVTLKGTLHQISNTGMASDSPFSANMRDAACARFFMEARAILLRLRLENNTFQTAQFQQGQVHHYFDEVRQIISAATQDILFIDPYLDADFVTRYVPQVPGGVTIRMLTSQGRASALGAAVVLYRQQHGATLEYRTVPNTSLHDRHLVIDGRDVYQSGASFKDGARNAATSINQVVDVATSMIQQHEQRWAAATSYP